MNKTKQKRNSKNWFKFFRIFIFVLIAVEFAAYLLINNSLASSGIVIKDLKNKISSLDENNEKIALEISNLASLERVKREAENLKMVKSDKFEYLFAPEAVVVAENK